MLSLEQRSLLRFSTLTGAVKAYQDLGFPVRLLDQSGDVVVDRCPPVSEATFTLTNRATRIEIPAKGLTIVTGPEIVAFDRSNVPMFTDGVTARYVFRTRAVSGHVAWNGSEIAAYLNGWTSSPYIEVPPTGNLIWIRSPKVLPQVPRDIAFALGAA